MCIKADMVCSKSNLPVFNGHKKLALGLFRNQVAQRNGCTTEVNTTKREKPVSPLPEHGTTEVLESRFYENKDVKSVKLDCGQSLTIGGNLVSTWSSEDSWFCSGCGPFIPKGWSCGGPFQILTGEWQRHATVVCLDFLVRILLPSQKIYVHKSIPSNFDKGTKCERIQSFVSLVADNLVTCTMQFICICFLCSFVTCSMAFISIVFCAIIASQYLRCVRLYSPTTHIPVFPTEFPA